MSPRSEMIAAAVVEPAVVRVDPPGPPPVEVELIGIKGIDFVNIWHSPESPQEMIRYDTSRDGYLRFRNALLVTRDEDEEAILRNASRRGRYLEADPDQRKPLVCQLCSWPFYNVDAFTRHTKFSHTGASVRK